tara:strand:+ start:22542 stop:23450 length:909 start_codon:yes stop_codon:yes gene_type:complete
MFSIITPTFNRAHTLERVFNSLNKQSLKEFEWIIIDDSSSDNTKQIVSDWQEITTSYKIHYYLLPENKGKPHAVNEALKYCTQSVTIIADSDDAFESNTIQELKQLWNAVNLTENSVKIASIWTLVKDEDNKLVGDLFPHNFWQVNFKERVLDRKKIITGEKWHSWRTSVLKKYKMHHSNHSFISESATWNRINKDYDFLCLNIFHRIYYASPDGLILKKKSRLELEKIKFYNSYYQLNETSLFKILKYPYYHHYAFDYIKSLFTYSEMGMKLGYTKLFTGILISIWYLPKRIFYYLIHKKG